MSFPIHDRDRRRTLEPRAKPYFARLSDGIHIGYRKGKSVSRWVVRRYDGKRYRMRTLPAVHPDDPDAMAVAIADCQFAHELRVLPRLAEIEVGCAHGEPVKLLF